MSKRRKKRIKKRVNNIDKNIKNYFHEQLTKKHKISSNRIERWTNDKKEEYHNVNKSVECIMENINYEVNYIADAIEMYEEEMGETWDGFLPYKEVNINDSMDLDRTMFGESDETKSILKCNDCKFEEIKQEESEGLDFNEVYLNL